MSEDIKELKMQIRYYKNALQNTLTKLSEMRVVGRINPYDIDDLIVQIHSTLVAEPLEVVYISEGRQ